MTELDYRSRLYEAYVESHYVPQGLVDPITHRRTTRCSVVVRRS